MNYGSFMIASGGTGQKLPEKMIFFPSYYIVFSEDGRCKNIRIFPHITFYFLQYLENQNKIIDSERYNR